MASPKHPRKAGTLEHLTSMLEEAKELQVKKEKHSDNIKISRDQIEELQKKIGEVSDRLDNLEKDIKGLKLKKSGVKIELKQVYLSMLKDDYYLV